MAAGYLNALSMMSGMQRSNNVLNNISNPQTLNPGQAIANAMQTAALAKYLRGGTVPTQSMRGIVSPGAVNVLGTPNTSSANAAGTTTAAPAATSSTAAPAASTAASPGWFMPRTTAANQGNSVYSGGRYTDTSPGTMPYSQWQQGSSDATANPVTSSGPGAAYSALASSILSDPSDASVHSAFGDFRNSGFGVYADYMHNQVLGMTPAQRLTWAQQLMQPQRGATYSPNVSVPANASSQVRNALTDFSAQTGSGLSVSP